MPHIASGVNVEEKESSSTYEQISTDSISMKIIDIFQKSLSFSITQQSYFLISTSKSTVSKIDTYALEFIAALVTTTISENTPSVQNQEQSE